MSTAPQNASWQKEEEKEIQHQSVVTWRNEIKQNSEILIEQEQREKASKPKRMA